MNDSEKNISVIIPCFNTQPAFLHEAIESVKNNSTAFLYEIIIVDDGSDKTETKQFLQNISDKNINVIYQSNQGPAAARNTGVKNTTSEYILFLDSDDRLLPGYIENGINHLAANSKAGVVYSNAIAFGDTSRTSFTAKPFNITELLLQNFIPMCAVIRRQAWKDVNGIDENLIQYEDWEFWIRIYKAGWHFVYIDKPMFEYRIQHTSLISQDRKINFRKAVDYIYKKHTDLVYECYHALYAKKLMYENDQQKPLRSFAKYFKNKLTN